ncbi:hypothetical protein P3W85_19445 [Cupriavidus basilensis]|uniref:Uncharacterized protein n=1 Tax=Cupriavidus basilensis TaxID=68895 RepID=A0ABT6AR71_9BURK|nr:hypothetical protein [Cupriavidus basilensis]MDF3835118.1 hypothetical protein [Cupriavidus basilensis]
MQAQSPLAWFAQRSLPRRLDGRLLFLCLVAYGGAMIWLAPHPPMVDLPQHAGQVAVLHDLLTGESPWHEVLRINLFTPYLTGYGLALLLSFFMPVAAAFKLLLTLGYYGFVGACLLLRRRFGADERLDWLFVPAYFGFAYEWGFFTFLVAAPLGLLFLLLADRYAERPTPATATTLLLAGVILFFSHGLVFLFAALVGASFLALKAGNLRRCLLALLPYGLLAMLCLLYAANARKLETSIVYASPGILWEWDWTRVFMFFLAPWSSWPQQALFAIDSLFVLAVPWLLGLRPNWRNPSACVPMLAVLAIWCLVPQYAMKTAFLYQRFGLFIFPCYALMFHQPPSRTKPAPRARQRARLCQVLLALICLTFFATHTKRLLDFAQESAEFDTLLAATQPAQRALMLIYDANSAAASHPGAYVHYAAWYQAEKKGLVDFNFAWFPPQIVRYSPDQLPALGPFNPSARRNFPQTFDWEAHRAREYRYFFVRGTPVPPSLLDNRRCDVILLKAAGSWSLYENRGCRS